MVERIEEFGPKLQPDVLVDLRVLEDADVELIQRYPALAVARHVAVWRTELAGRADSVVDETHGTWRHRYESTGRVQCVEGVQPGWAGRDRGPEEDQSGIRRRNAY